jgi:hypothetical protein
MKPNTPILMLSLLIPVTPDVSPEQVINIIGHQVVEAMQQIRAQQQAANLDSGDEVNGDPEAIPQQEFNASLLHETLESYSDETSNDLLAKLGYSAEV